MLKKSEFTARLEAELQSRIDGVLNVSAFAREIVEALAGEVQWAPEDAEEPMPRRLRLQEYSGQYMSAAIVPDDDEAGCAPLLAGVPADWPADIARVPILRAMVDAYNRERQEERIEAEVGATLDEDLEHFYRREIREEAAAEIKAAVDAGLQLAREEIDGKISTAVHAERARCLAHLDWLLGCFPEGWDWSRRMTEHARRRVESGAPAPSEPSTRPSEQDIRKPDRPLPYGFMNTPAAAAPLTAPLVDAAAFDFEGFEKSGLEAPPNNWPTAWDDIQNAEHGFAYYLTGRALEETRRRWLEEPLLRAQVAAFSAVERKVRERLREERDIARDENLDLRARVSSARAALASNWTSEWTAAKHGDRSGPIGLLYKILTGPIPETFAAEPDHRSNALRLANELTSAQRELEICRRALHPFAILFAEHQRQGNLSADMFDGLRLGIHALHDIAAACRSMDLMPKGS